MARKRLVAGNWKMHGSKAAVDRFMAEIAAADTSGLDADMLICPPHVYLQQSLAAASQTALRIGAQDICEQAGPGAFTGEISAPMLADIGASHAIVGHSERRHIYGEDDQLVAAKFQAAQASGLIPVLCVGESLEEREADQTEVVLARQLQAVIDLCGAAALEQSVIAYEPVWAIGTGRTASPEQAQTAHAFLRAQIANQDAILAPHVRIVYGGSVKPNNAAELFACEDVDGGLIGGASLEAESFLAICRA